MFERLYFRYKEQPTEWTLETLIRELCKMDDLWFAAKVSMPNSLKELENTNGAIVVLSDDANMRGGILVSQDGVRAYLVFTDVEKILVYRDHFYKDKGALAIGKTSMEDVLNAICQHNATYIVVNYMHSTQIILDETAVAIAQQIMLNLKQECTESSDEQYKKGREYSNKATRLYFGTGVPKDKTAALEMSAKAAQLLQIAAERDNTKAQYDLGLLIRNGKGVEQNFEKAAYWLRQSVANSDKDEKIRIEEMIAEFEFYKSKTRQEY